MAHRNIRGQVVLVFLPTHSPPYVSLKAPQTQLLQEAVPCLQKQFKLHLPRFKDGNTTCGDRGQRSVVTVVCGLW